MSRAPKTLTVVIEDRHRTYIAVVHENEHVPYERRTVQIELTDEQRAALEPRRLGSTGGVDQFEDIRECWFEPPATPTEGEA